MFQEAPCTGADSREPHCSHEARWLLLQKFPQSATDFVFFTDEKVFSVASPDSRQNDHVYAPHDTRKRSIAAERWLHCRRRLASRWWSQWPYQSSAVLHSFSLSQAPAQVTWFFCVSLLILNGEVCERDIAINVSELRNDFDMALHRGSFVVLYVCSHLSVRRRVAPSQNVEVENTVILFFCQNRFSRSEPYSKFDVPNLFTWVQSAIFGT